MFLVDSRAGDQEIVGGLDGVSHALLRAYVWRLVLCNVLCFVKKPRNGAECKH